TIDNRLEDTPEAELAAVALQLEERIRGERPDRRSHRVGLDRDDQRDLAAVLTAGEQRLDGHLQVFELLVGQREPRSEASDHEMRNRAKVLLRGQHERDLVAQEASPASCSSSTSSCSRRAAASLPASTA